MKVYQKHSEQDQRRIVTTANRGEDWVGLSTQLSLRGAYQWVDDALQPEEKSKIPTAVEVDVIISWIKNTGITPKQIKSKILNYSQKPVSVSTTGNYLVGTGIVLLRHLNIKLGEPSMCRTLKQLNPQPRTQTVWFDETNFNPLFRCTRGRPSAGNRSVQNLPANQGPNVYIFSAISAAGSLLWSIWPFIDRQDSCFLIDSLIFWT